jgi:hypothetical protein
MATCAIPDLSQPDNLKLRDRETIKSREQTFVYLAYLDDSDTKDKAAKWQVMVADMIPDYLFGVSELMLSFVIQNVIPEEKMDDFEEFHASELFGGYGVFQGIDQQKRHLAIESLLDVIITANMHIAYGAVDLDFLRNQDYRSANPQDIAFRSCVKGIQNWLSDLSMQNLKNADIASGGVWESPIALLIADAGDKKDNAELQKSFRELRKKLSFHRILETVPPTSMTICTLGIPNSRSVSS